MDKYWFFGEFAKKGMSLRQTASAIGVHSSALSRMLNGKRKMQIADAERLAQIFGVPLDAVLVHAGFQPGMSEEAAPFVRDDEMAETSIESKNAKHPLFGCMKGTSFVMPGVDLTKPVDAEWAKVYDADHEVKLHNE